MIIKPTDLIFYRGRGPLSRLIQWVTEGWPSHISVATSAGILSDKPKFAPLVVEALAGDKVVERPLQPYNGDLAIARAKNIPWATKMDMLVDIRREVGQDYSERVLLYHLLGWDKWLAKIYGWRWRVCSIVPARVWTKYGFTFSSDHPASLSPAEIYNYVEAECSKPDGNYRWVKPPPGWGSG